MGERNVFRVYQVRRLLPYPSKSSLPSEDGAWDDVDLRYYSAPAWADRGFIPPPTAMESSDGRWIYSQLCRGSWFIRVQHG